MLVSTLGLGEILDLPRQYGTVIRALADIYTDMQPLISDCFILVSDHQGHIIWRVGAEQLLQKLTELRIAPGFSCSSLSVEASAAPQRLGADLWVRGTKLPHRQDVCVWIGRETASGTPASLMEESDADPVAYLLVRYFDLKTRMDTEENERRQFAIERRKLETFYQLTSELSELSTPEEILEMVVQRVSQLMDAGTTIVYGHNPAQTRLIPLCGYKIPSDQLTVVRYEVETSNRLIRRVYESGQIKRIDDISEMEPGESVAVLGDLGLRSILIVPIRLRDRRLGVVVVGRYVRQPFETGQAEVLSFVAHQIALILDNSRLRASLNKRLQDVDRELNLAKGMQALMVPRAPLIARDYQIAGETLAAKQLGGDYFDYFVQQGRLNVIVADIMGKGVSAALLMAILRSHFRTVFQQNPRLSVSNVNRFSELVYADFKPQRAFATVLLMSLNLNNHELSVFSAGHHAPLLAGPGGVRDLIPVTMPALGLFNRSIDGKAVQKYRLRPGEALLAYSDGIPDAVSDVGERFGTARLRDVLAAAYLERTEPAQLLHAVRIAVDQFAASQPDDSTLCVLQRNDEQN